MVFDMEIIKHFGIRETFEEGRQVRTIGEISDLILGHFLQSDASVNDLKKLIKLDAGKPPPILPALIERVMRSLAWFASWAVGLGILFVLMEYADWPLVLVIIPVVLGFFDSGKLIKW